MINERETTMIDIDRLKFPRIHIRQTSNLAITPASLFGLALGLVMLTAPMMEWINYESPTLGTCLMFAGLCEYIIGIYDWYQGKSAASTIDFMFGLLHLTIYYTAELGKYYDMVTPHKYYSYMQGTFYCLFLAICLVLLIAIKDKGIIYLIAFFIICIGLIFVIIWEFGQRRWQRMLAGYIIFVGACFIWLAGLGKILVGVFQMEDVPCVTPIL